MLAIGGGSVIDSTKAISAGWSLDSEPTAENIWSIVENQSPISKALPVYDILTLSATGTEGDPTFVI